MKSVTIKIFLVFAALLITFAAAEAATKGRIIPNGRVSLIKDGRIVTSFTEQAPIDDSALISCAGSCMVKMRSFSLIGADQSVFGIKEMNNSTALYVKKGKIDFILADTSRQLAFYSPDGNFIRTEGFLVPASTDNAVRGFINVTGQTTEIGMERGSMIVQTSNGTRTIAPGQVMRLAMAEIPDQSSLDGAGFDNKSPGWWSSLSRTQQFGVLSGGALFVAGVGKLTFNNHNNDNKSPLGPPASPNQ